MMEDFQLNPETDAGMNVEADAGMNVEADAGQSQKKPKKAAARRIRISRKDTIAIAKIALQVDALDEEEAGVLAAELGVRRSGAWRQELVADIVGRRPSAPVIVGEILRMREMSQVEIMGMLWAEVVPMKGAWAVLRALGVLDGPFPANRALPQVGAQIAEAIADGLDDRKVGMCERVRQALV